MLIVISARGNTPVLGPVMLTPRSVLNREGTPIITVRAAISLIVLFRS